MNKIINEGIIVNGGKLKGKNIVVGKQASIQDINEKDIKKGNKKSQISNKENPKSYIKIEKIKSLIRENRLDEVFILLNDFFDKTNSSQIELESLTILEAKYNLIKKERDLNLIDFERFNVEISKIIRGIVSIVNNPNNGLH